MAKPGLPTSASHLPILIAGPTAAGKSQIALQLAEQLGGEIISADSMQVYRGLDIGTAKPSAAERARMPHHLIDICDLTESFDAAQFVRLAHRAVGGNSVARATCRFFAAAPGFTSGRFSKDWVKRRPPMPNCAPNSKPRRWKNCWPNCASATRSRYEKIDKQNPRRVIRAVEVIRLTGRPVSVQRADWSSCHLSPVTCHFHCLTRQPDDLRKRIDARVDEMFARGLVDETRELLKHGLAENQTAMQAIGYRQVVEHLRGERPLKETIELVKIRTRQFAKRQLTWFRAQKNLEWIELQPEESAEAIARTIRTKI